MDWSSGAYDLHFTPQPAMAVREPNSRIMISWSEDVPVAPAPENTICS